MCLFQMRRTSGEFYSDTFVGFGYFLFTVSVVTKCDFCSQRRLMLIKLNSIKAFLGVFTFTRITQETAKIS